MAVNSVTAVAPRPMSRGQSQWALIWREFRKRKLALAATAVILFLITTSIFAPFLANGLPIYYFGINRFEYQEAGRILRATLTQLIDARSKDKPAADNERYLKTISLQVSRMADGLPSDKASELREQEQQILKAAVSADKTAAIADLQRLQRELRSKFDAKEVTLVSQSHWPVIGSLDCVDIGFILADVLLILSPLWVRILYWTVPIQRERLRRFSVLMILAGLPVAAGLIWWFTVPSRVDRTEYKNGVLAADENSAKAPVVFESVLWPPIVYGLDEYDLAGKSELPALYQMMASNSKDGDDKSPVKDGSPQADAADKPAGRSAASPWGGPHWLGTDESGRDLLCRLIWGGRVSLSVGLVAVGIYVTIGILVGAIAGYFRGVCDLIVSRLIEVMICFPTFFLILTIVAFFGPSIRNIMLIIGFTGWTGIARLVRGEFLRLVDQEFVLAGRALGYSPARIIFRHVLPNAMAPVLVSATFGIAGAILTESALSFLGLGVSKPTPSWGALLHDGREALTRAPWLIHFPGIAIFVTITAYNLIGEALRDAADPRLRGSR